MSTEWEALTEKLRKMGVQLGLEKPLQESPLRRKPIEDLISGREVKTNFGPVFSVAHHYDADHIQGKQILQPAGSWQKLAEWAKAADLAEASLENFVFLDTETTGLSVGTGTMAFLIGVGKFEGEGFHLEQYFLRNPTEESAQLAALVAFCDEMEAVITYNGKSFDIPILNTRFILQGMNSPFEALAHFDLLHLTRRVWKARLEHCNLGVIEKAILEMERTEEDIPGYLASEYYLDYLRTGDSTSIKGIFYHNEQDVVSLAALFARLADILENPLTWQSNSHQDLNSLGRVLERMGKTELALQIYDRSFKEEFNEESLLRSAKLSKKLGNWEQAVLFWQLAGEDSVEALEELAKYYEHHLKNYQLAQDCTLKGIKVLERNYPEEHTSMPVFKALQHRLHRLEIKRKH